MARRGFTLAEVLVTLAVIAVMAAVLLPALNQQLTKGNVGRLASGLTNIQTASQAFVSDVHRYPDNVAQLTTSVTSPDGKDIKGVLIPSSFQGRWKGPYISRDEVPSTRAGGTITPAFSLVTLGGIQYLAVTVSSLTASNFADIEAVLDEGTPSTTSSTAGTIRYSSGNSTLTFLALPIQ